MLQESLCCEHLKEGEKSGDVLLSGGFLALCCLGKEDLRPIAVWGWRSRSGLVAHLVLVGPCFFLGHCLSRDSKLQLIQNLEKIVQRDVYIVAKY